MVDTLIWGYIVAAMLGLAVFVPAAPSRVSLGGAGFMALGAMVAEFASGFTHGSIMAQVMIGAASAACAGVVVGFALRRFDDKNFALATLAFSVAMALIATNDRQMQSVIIHKVFPQHASILEGVLALAISIGICRAAAGSRFAYGAGAMAAAIVGVLIPAEVAFGTTPLIEQLCLAVGVAVIGGRRSVFGPALGALIVACVLPLLDLTGRGQMIVAGLLLIAAYVWLPDGLLGIANRVFGSLKARHADGAA
jgi:ABC-type branched-subunit amino acid transport system permease subunit